MKQLRLIAAAILAASVFVVPASLRSAQAAERPNILFIVTDDQRSQAFSTMPETRRLFKQEGRLFPSAFVTTPVCCQSRASIMTGRYVHNHGVRRFTPYKLDQSTTIQSYLSEVGYRNGIFGKYLNNWNLEDDPPAFDRWAIFPQSNESTYVGGEWNLDGTLTHVSQYSTDFISDQASDFLTEAEGQDDQPWFLYLAPPAAHPPFVAEERYAHMPVTAWAGNAAVFEDDLRDKPPYVRRFSKPCDYKCGVDTRTAQLRTLASVDDMIANIYTQIEELGEGDQTLAVFVSDNGLMWGEHGLAGKRLPYAPSVSVPLMMRWPGTIPPGVDRRLAANIDLTPTALAAAGVRVGNNAVDGMSLLGKARRSKLLLERWRGGGIPRWMSIQGRGWQYIESYHSGGGAFREYYDLEQDPHQLTNLIRDRDPNTGPSESELKELRERLRDYRSCAGTPCP